MIRIARVIYLAVLLAIGVLGWQTSADAQQTRRWGVVTGDPQGTIPPETFKYPDAVEACKQENPVPPPSQCVVYTPGSVTVSGGNPNPPQNALLCVVQRTCLCGDCLILPPDNPSNTKFVGTGRSAVATTLPCPSGTDYLGRCDPDPAKAKGVCTDCDLAKANPANIGSGNKYQGEVIYRSATLELVLYYNSQVGVSYYQTGPFGSRWSSRYFVRARDAGQFLAIDRPDGRELEFRAPASGNIFVAQGDVSDRLERVPNGTGGTLRWRLTSADGDRVEEHHNNTAVLREWWGTLERVFDRTLLSYEMGYVTPSTPPSVAPFFGLLLSVTDPFGRQLGFTYDAKGRVASMTDPAGGTYLFQYDGPSGPANANNLTRVTFPGGATRVYFYAEAANINGGVACATPPAGQANLLTGIQDENGARFATYTYDCLGRATSSQHALGADLHTFTYGSVDRTVVDPLGTTRTTPIQRVLGVAKAAGVAQPAAIGTGTVSRASAFDANGNLASRTDFNGNRTNYVYDLARNLETSRTEGLTSAARHAADAHHQHAVALHVPPADGDRRAAAHHDQHLRRGRHGMRRARCAVLEERPGDHRRERRRRASPRPPSGTPRVWTYTYNANGSVLTVNGPRTDATDVTTYTYYANNDADPGKRGNVATITNAAGPHHQHHRLQRARPAAHHRRPERPDHDAGLRRAPAPDLAHGRLGSHHLRLRRRRPAHQGDAARRLVPRLRLRRRAPPDRDLRQPRQPDRVHARRDGQPHRGAGARSVERARADAQPRLQQPEPPVPGARRAEPDHRVRLRQPGQRHLGEGPAQQGDHEPVRRAQPPEAGDRPGHSASRSTATTASTRSSR